MNWTVLKLTPVIKTGLAKLVCILMWIAETHYSRKLEDEFWEVITVETNWYMQTTSASADVQDRAEISKGSICGWNETIYWCLFLDGCHGSTQNSWSFAKTVLAKLHTILCAGYVMSMNPGKKLSQLHIVDNSEFVPCGQVGHDRLFKNCNLFHMILPRFSDNYQAGEELTLDEKTIAYKGRSTIKHYKPKKPDKWSEGFCCM